MKFSKELDELVQAGVIDSATAEKITNYYTSKAGPPQNRLTLVFGILGAVLVGLGIVLILGNNWDALSRTVKTAIAFLPLLAGQIICAFTLLRQKESLVWREGSATFLVLTIGACISLVALIYNIQGQMDSFLLTWCLLALPVIYVMRSSAAALLYIIGITWYACEAGYWGSHTYEPYAYWGLLILVLPHYVMLSRTYSESNFFTVHNWFIPISVTIALGTVAVDSEELMFLAYMCLFGLLYQIGHIPKIDALKVRNNGYLVIGALGSVAILLAVSFEWYWNGLQDGYNNATIAWLSPEIIAAGLLFLGALILLILNKRKQSPFVLKPAELAFILFALIFFVGLFSPIAILLVNALVLSIGILTIREGALQNHFGILNYGLLIITALIISRFFDSNIPFILKGVMFVAVGAGFFYANYRMANRIRRETVNTQN